MHSRTTRCRSPSVPGRATSLGRWTSRSPDGRISFKLRRCKRGLYAERLHAKAEIGRLVQAIVFQDEAGFTRWCDADNARFAYPLIFDKLRRAGCEILSHRAAGDDAPGDLGRA
jgi:hypothetical protein